MPDSQARGSQAFYSSDANSAANGRSPVACQGLFGLGFGEIAVVVGIAALVFGPSKLPELGKGLGQTVKSFQTAAKEFETELKQGMKEDEKPADGAAAEKKPESK
eukprot:CAMPEP_0202865924 /NCGR_PEP_ID=MMETSP1391-20130828/6696_1 /ASSEMBLY_ACC=CAM_ASM_000867 /TAXON_ID=1034604 /ORGANISM="Chlamydomonas leiostraca, Strain SAG 11-49" /LENGTH=104 /DNA_ID=CAMNT_0049545815 /DNA_START=115 /DNA_END=430 /DNA_ORIENTATION=-